jgi:hypothetical protein
VDSAGAGGAGGLGDVAAVLAPAVGGLVLGLGSVWVFQLRRQLVSARFGTNAVENDLLRLGGLCSANMGFDNRAALGSPCLYTLLGVPLRYVRPLAILTVRIAVIL